MEPFKNKISTYNVTHNETSDQNRIKAGLPHPISTVEPTGTEPWQCGEHRNRMNALN